MMERTLIIVKPNATGNGKIGAILKMFEEGGLKIIALKMLKLTMQEARRFYEVHKDRPFYESLVKFMCSAPVVVGVLEGESCIERCRQIMGATDPARAKPGTIRALYGENIQNNSIHGSDSPENARKEIEFFFPGQSFY